MKIVSPVIPGCEQYEVNMGQRVATDASCDAGIEYQAMPNLRSPDGRLTSRWTFTEEERQAIAAGADLFMTIMTFNHPLQRTHFEVGQPDANGLGHFMRDMRIEEEYELRMLMIESAKAQQEMEARYKAVLEGDEEVNRLAQRAQQVKAAFERKKQEVFSPQESKIHIVQ